MSLQPERRPSSMLDSVREKIRHDFAYLLILLRGTYAAFKDDGGRALSAALVYYSTLSVVPLLLILPGSLWPRCPPRWQALVALMLCPANKAG